MAGGQKTIKVRFAATVKGLTTAVARVNRSLNGMDKASRVASRGLGTVGTAAIALGPAVIPVVAAATAAVIGLGAAMAGAGAAAGVFGAVAGTAFVEVKEAADKTDDLREKIRLLGRQAEIAPPGMKPQFLKAQKKAMIELEARLSLLDPATRKVVVAYGNMKNAWLDFVDTNKPATFAVMTGGFGLLSKIIPKLQPLFDVGARAAWRFLAPLEAAVANGTLDRLVMWLARRAEPAMESFANIARNAGLAIGRTLAKFAPGGQGVLDWLENATAKWAAWTAQVDQPGGLNAFIDYVKQNGPQVVAMAKEIGTALGTIAAAVGPLAPLSLAVATELAKILAALPPDVLRAIVVAIVAYSAAAKVAGASMAVWKAGADTVSTVQDIMKSKTAGNIRAFIQWGATAIAQGARVVAGWVMAGAAAVKQGAIMVAQGARVVAGWVLMGVQATLAGARMAIAWIVGLGPIAWVVAAIAAVIAIIVAIAVKTDWFQRAWNAAWGWVKSAASNVWDWLKSLPGKIGDAFAKVSGLITAPFKAAFNKIADLWNGTVGKLSFNVPSWVPGIGGKGFNMPNLPQLQHGGPAMAGRSYLVGERGPEILNMGPQSGHVTSNADAFGGPDVLRATFDLGHGIQKVVDINLREHDRTLRSRANAGAGRRRFG